MFLSIIIPTLFKCDLLFKSIEMFNDTLIENDELILIDNVNSSHDFGSSKINHLKFKENNFVNKSWNIGVERSKNDIVVLMNDDIIFNYKCFRKNIIQFLNSKEKIGVVGLDNTFFKKHDFCQNASTIKLNSLNSDDDNLNFIETSGRNKGFGMLMSLHKKNYITIPDELKIFYGDDVLFNKNIRNKNTNFKIQLKSSGYVGASSHKYDGIRFNEMDRAKRYL